MSQELKPCPFCGGRADYAKPRSGFKGWVVICAEDVEDCDVKVETLPFKDKEGAAKSWNARSDAHLLRSLRELLREYSDKHDCRICVGDDGCDLCKRTDAALTEAAALELQKEQSK